jgi:hypothetical protein
MRLSPVLGSPTLHLQSHSHHRKKRLRPAEPCERSRTEPRSSARAKVNDIRIRDSVPEGCFVTGTQVLFPKGWKGFESGLPRTPSLERERHSTAYSSR